MRRESDRRIQQNLQFEEHTAAINRWLGPSLDAMSQNELRRLFAEAFTTLSEFEWALKERRGRISGPQRAALLRALAGTGAANRD